MLHEVILGLSGFPSPLFDSSSEAGGVASDFPLLSPPETALLSSIGQLALRHRNVRDHVRIIASSHQSTVCRAVAGTVASVQLARFQQKVLDVEANILEKDSSMVAAYDIVPLAAIVAEFEDWKRRMDWLWATSAFMLPTDSMGEGAASRQSTGADLINKLRKEAQTGYPDIEEMALELSEVAERAWLRQLSSWVLYGKLPSIGASDFGVRISEGEDEEQYSVDRERLPAFVLTDTADSILFIGRSLNQIRNRGLAAQRTTDQHIPTELELLPTHLQALTSIVFPITSANLSSAISAIRTSLSQNTLQRLLPLERITEILRLLYDFFLLGRGEFAGILIGEADRNIGLGDPKTGRNSGGLVFKDSELSNTLSKSFAVLSAISSDEHDEHDSHDAILELARSLTRLQVDKSRSHKKDRTLFNDMLLSIPTKLSVKLVPPIDLFLSQADLSTYSDINGYLLSIERAHIHLSSLWRLTSIRRDHPCPPGPPRSTTQSGQRLLKQRRQRRTRREIKGRKVWATISKAVYFLTELIMHLEGTVVQSAWRELYAIITDDPDSGRPQGGGTTTPLSSSTRMQPDQQSPTLPPRTRETAGSGSRPSTGGSGSFRNTRDPSTLAALHQVYLSALTDALLLNNVAFTKELKPLLLSVDNLAAQMRRLETVQVNLDLEEDDGVVDGLNDWAKEEQTVLLELDRARKKVDEGLGACIDVLSQIDLGHDRTLLTCNRDGKTGGQPAAVEHPEWKWRAPGVDRLLMKLEFGSVARGEDDADEST